MSLEIKNFWFDCERTDNRRDKSYGLTVKFSLSVNNKLDYRTACEALRQDGYSSCDVFSGKDYDTLHGNIFQTASRPKDIPDSSKVINSCGGLEKIKQDFIRAAEAGSQTYEERKLHEELAGQARVLFDSYHSAIASEARELTSYNEKIKELNEAYRRVYLIEANALFEKYPHTTGVLNESKEEYTAAKRAIEVARAKILDHARNINPDNFFSRGGGDLISAKDFQPEQPEQEKENE